MAENTFSLELSKFLELVEGNSHTAVRKIVLEVGKSVVEKTPVGDPSLWKSAPPPGYVGGRARASWSHAEGHMPTEKFDAIDPSDADTNVSTKRIEASIPDTAAGKIHFIGNNLPYIERLEKGWSTQAPNGMVELTAAEFQTFVDDVVKELGE